MAAYKPSAAKKLINLLKASDERDLEEIDREIAALKARLAAVQQARDLIAQEVLNRGPKAKQATPPPTNGKVLDASDGNMRTIKDAIAKFLLEYGPAMTRKIVSALGSLGSQNIEHCLNLNPSTFEKEGQVWKLSNEARAKYDVKQRA